MSSGTLTVAPAELAARVARARLSAAEAHQTFRAVLDALSRPGTVTTLPAGRVPPVLLPTLALADHGTTVCVLGAPDWTDPLCTATSAEAASPERAAFVTLLDGAVPRAGFQVGDPAAPERAALVIAAVADVLAGGPRLRLRGPGIAGSASIAPAGCPPGLLAARAGAAFPAGFDLLLVDAAGRVVGLPRSTTAELTTDPTERS